MKTKQACKDAAAGTFFVNLHMAPMDVVLIVLAWIHTGHLCRSRRFRILENEWQELWAWELYLNYRKILTSILMWQKHSQIVTSPHCMLLQLTLVGNVPCFLACRRAQVSTTTQAQASPQMLVAVRIMPSSQSTEYNTATSGIYSCSESACKNSSIWERWGIQATVHC